MSRWSHPPRGEKSGVHRHDGGTGEGRIPSGHGGEPAGHEPRGARRGGYGDVEAWDVPFYTNMIMVQQQHRR